MTKAEEILKLHVEKIGGFEKLKNLKSIYTEGTLELLGTGLSGSSHDIEFSSTTSTTIPLQELKILLPFAKEKSSAFSF